jgi:hypothetical protein
VNLNFKNEYSPTSTFERKEPISVEETLNSSWDDTSPISPFSYFNWQLMDIELKIEEQQTKKNNNIPVLAIESFRVQTERILQWACCCLHRTKSTINIGIRK